MTTRVPPGWYADPGVPGQIRWWDGTNWTAEVMGRPSEAAQVGPLPISGRKRVWPWLVGSALLLLIVVIIAAAVTNPPTPPQSATTNAEERQALRAWASGGGARYAAAVSADSSAVASEATTSAAELVQTGADSPSPGRLKQLRDACTRLRRDVVAAHDYAPLPNAEAEASWSRALTMLFRMSSLCLRGTDPFDADLMSAATAASNEANASLNQTNLVLEAATGIRLS